MNKAENTSVQDSFFAGSDQVFKVEQTEKPVFPKVEAGKGLGRNCLNGGRLVGHRAVDCTAGRCY